jgi:hypothetical protein
MKFLRLCTSLLFSAALLIGPYASKPAHAAPVITSCSGGSFTLGNYQVAFYEHANYGGQCWLVTIDAPYLEPWVGNAGITNDVVSSVRIGGKVALALYQDQNYGAVLGVWGSEDDSVTLVPYVGDTANDQMSAFVLGYQQ